MQPKQIEVSCPCCDSILLIDTLTGTVMRHARPQEVDETGKVVLDESRWDDAHERIRERRHGSGDRFDDALSKEQGREADLDDLFEKAKRKALGPKDEDDSSTS